MKTCFPLFVGLLASAVSATAAKSPLAASDILPSNLRQEVVERAAKLARPPVAVSIPTDLPQPFSPKNFDKPDPDEVKANAPAGVSSPVPAAATPSGPTSDREILETLAARLIPSGTINLGESAQLIIGMNRFPVGTKFTVTFSNEDYELELVSIDRTTFKLRYRNEEITRPIKPVR